MLWLHARFGQQEDALRRIADEEFLEFRPRPNDTSEELFAKYELAREQHRLEGERVFTWQEHTTHDMLRSIPRASLDLTVEPR